MPGVPTPILGLAVPTIGGDVNSWGGELNADLAIPDNLGALAIFNINSNYSAIVSTAPETVIRVTTGAGTIVVTLPNPAICNGKLFTIKKVDSGVGQVSVVGAIDGQASYIIGDQFSYVRLMSNGASYDVIGNG